MIQSTVGFTSPSFGSGDGLPGNDGDSAYQVAVNNGFVGTEQQWLDSLVGPAGADGADGAQGPKGDQGDPGPAGADGADGADGAQGPKGDQGDPGPAGADGADGAQGPKGDKGDTGATGAGGALGYYGSFYDIQTQTVAQGQESIGIPVKVRSLDKSNGISVVNDSKITFAHGGVYDMQFSFQFHNTGGGGNGTTVEIWLTKNGQAIPDTNTRVAVNTNSPYVVSAWDFIVEPADNDYYEMYWATDNHHIEMAHNTGLMGGPAIPSAIITVMQVMYTQLGPTGATGATGPGVPSGGTSGQYLTKVNGTDYNTQWSTLDLSTKQDVVSGVSSTEIGYLDGVTSSIQTQLNSKVGSDHAHTSSNITDFNEAAQDAVGSILGSGLTYTDSSNTITVNSSVVQLRVANVSDTEIGYLDGVTSAIQTQLDNKVSAVTPLTLTQSSNSLSYPLAISSANQQNGGAGYSDILKLTNSKSGASNINKYLRLSDSGNLEIINSAYSTAAFVLTDGGNLSVSGTIGASAYTAGQHIKTTIWSASDMGFTSTYNNGSNTYAAIASKTYTPASASSYIFVEVYARYYVNGAAEDSFFSQLTWAGNEFAAQRQYWANASGGGTRSSTLFPLAGRITNGSLTGYTLAINARRDSADDTLSVYADGAFNVKITEIAR